jgi:hypothetical protein
MSMSCHLAIGEIKFQCPTTSPSVQHIRYRKHFSTFKLSSIQQSPCIASVFHSQSPIERTVHCALRNFISSALAVNCNTLYYDHHGNGGYKMGLIPYLTLSLRQLQLDSFSRIVGPAAIGPFSCWA